LKKSISILIAVCLCTLAFAGPARRGVIKLTQPDGTTVSAILKGDEYYHVLTDLQGHALIQDESGYFCYARYEADGTKVSTGYHAGAKVPAEVLSVSSAIPHALLLTQAEDKRIAEAEKESSFNGLMRLNRKATGGIHKKCIVLLANFANLAMTHTHEHFINVYTQDNYTFEGARGSVRQYYTEQFGDDCSFEFVVAPIVTLSQNRSYYGANNDRNAGQAVVEACQLSDEAVDFSQFDSDGDGVVDNVFVIVAGCDEAESGEDDAIWGHKSSVNLTLDGVRISTYNICSELAWRIQLQKFSLTTIGALCHEFGHTLGLKDMYDTDQSSSGGTSEALNKYTAVMDEGCYNNDCTVPAHFNAIDYDHLGYGECEELKPGSYTLRPIALERKYYKVSNTANDGEYYLIECRDHSNWDEYIQGKGLAIYHIDKSSKSFETTGGRGSTGRQRWGNNTVNCNPAHQCADMMEPDVKTPMAQRAFFPYESKNEFSPITTPSFKFWDGTAAPVSITDVMINADGSVSFNVQDNTTYLIPKVKNIEKSIFQEKAIISFKGSAISDEASATVKYGPKGGAQKEEKLSPNADGLYILILEGLTPGSDYTVTAKVDLGSGYVTDDTDMSFTTFAIDAHGEPYIYLATAGQAADGSFAAGASLPLVAFNTTGAKDVRWYFDDKVIYPSKDGTCKLSKSGVLKAVIRYTDGDSETITKHITVK